MAMTSELTLLVILVMNDLISRFVGQLFWHGASAHFRHLGNRITVLKNYKENDISLYFFILDQLRVDT